MLNVSSIFHLAVPCRDLDEAVAFYVDGFGCRLARRYEDRVTFAFFGHQLVCHLSPDRVPASPEPYPRHFGITFRDRADFDDAHDRAQRAGLPFVKQRFVRFADLREVHEAFFVADPSNNVIEFKVYDDPAMAY